MRCRPSTSMSMQARSSASSVRTVPARRRSSMCCRGIHPATLRQHPVRRTRQHHPPAAASRHPLRHRPHIPEPAPVQPDDGAGERARRHGVAHRAGLLSIMLALPGARAEKAAAEQRAMELLGLFGSRLAPRRDRRRLLAVLRQSPAPGDRPRTGHRTAPAAARRTGRRHEPERDPRADGRHPAHPRPRPDDTADRTRHATGARASARALWRSTMA